MLSWLTGGSPLLRSSSGWRSDSVGEACLPKDVINLVRGDGFSAVRKACYGKANREEGGGGGSSGCPAECRQAIEALKAQLCFPSLSQSQRLQPRFGGVSLSAMAGTWYGLYPASGVDLLELTYDPSSSTLSGTKLTGNSFVGAGRMSWEATPSGCRVVSSVWAGQFTPRWDPCTLTMWEDKIQIDLGADQNPEDTLSFVRARAPLLLEWEDERSPAYGVGAAFAECGEDVEAATPGALLDGWLHWLHHSDVTVVLDQLLMAGLLVLAPLLVAYLAGAGDGGLSDLLSQQPLLRLGAGGFCVLLCARLVHLGYLT
jgi:hypothetical protein